MAPKRARTAAGAAASASSSSQSATATTKLTLHGGVPHHPALAGLWRDERLTDFALSAEGVEFKAQRPGLDPCRFTLVLPGARARPGPRRGARRESN